MKKANIEWARALEREGVHVVYGLLGLKVHSKVILVGSPRRRCHPPLLSFGYRQLQPRHRASYTDLGLFTCDEEIGADATDLFN